MRARKKIGQWVRINFEFASFLIKFSFPSNAEVANAMLYAHRKKFESS